MSTFKIRHKESNRFVIKGSSMSWASTILNGVLTGSRKDFKIEWALTKGQGYTYNTRKGAEHFMNTLDSEIRDQFEIVEFGEIK